MSYRLKVIIFVLAMNIMALAVGYLMRGLGLYWFIPGIFLMAWGAVLVSRRWVKASSEWLMPIDYRLSDVPNYRLVANSVIEARRTNVVETADSWNLQSTARIGSDSHCISVVRARAATRQT